MTLTTMETRPTIKEGYHFTFHPVALPLVRPYRWAWGAHKEKYGVLVSVCSAAGQPIGWGEIAPPPDVSFQPAEVVAELATLAEGLNPLAAQFISQLDKRTPHTRYRNGLVSAALTAQAYQQGISLSRYLTAENYEKVQVNGYIEAVPPGEAVQRAHKLTGQGISIIKIKCTADVEADIERVTALATTFPDLTFRLDPNASWPAKQCTKIFERFQELPIQYVEEPVPTHANLSLLRDLRSIIPVAVDHWGSTREELLCIFEADATDFVILKSQVLGGPDRMRDIATLCQEFGRAAVVTASLETLVGITIAAHCAAALPSNTAHHGLYLWDYITPNVGPSPQLTEGRLAIHRSPGLGFTPDLAHIIS